MHEDVMDRFREGLRALLDDVGDVLLDDRPTVGEVDDAVDEIMSAFHQRAWCEMNASIARKRARAVA